MRIKEFLKLFSTSIAAGLPAAMSFQTNANQIEGQTGAINLNNEGTTPIQFQDTLNNSAVNLYAAHSSHSSHASHASHSSHYSSSGGGYSASPSPAPVTPSPKQSQPQSQNKSEIMYDKQGKAYMCTPQESGPPICQPVLQKQNNTPSIKDPIRLESYNDLDEVDDDALAHIVIRAQIALKLKGLYQGGLTKHLNQESRDIIRQFQVSNGLNQEGFLNTETLDALGIHIG